MCLHYFFWSPFFISWQFYKSYVVMQFSLSDCDFHDYFGEEKDKSDCYWID